VAAIRLRQNSSERSRNGRKRTSNPWALLVANESYPYLVQAYPATVHPYLRGRQVLAPAGREIEPNTSARKVQTECAPSGHLLPGKCDMPDRLKTWGFIRLLLNITADFAILFATMSPSHECKDCARSRHSTASEAQAPARYSQAVAHRASKGATQGSFRCKNCSSVCSLRFSSCCRGHSCKCCFGMYQPTFEQCLWPCSTHFSLIRDFRRLSSPPCATKSSALNAKRPLSVRDCWSSRQRLQRKKRSVWLLGISITMI